MIKVKLKKFFSSKLMIGILTTGSVVECSTNTTIAKLSVIVDDSIGLAFVCFHY